MVHTSSERQNSITISTLILASMVGVDTSPEQNVAELYSFKKCKSQENNIVFMVKY
jgi:hypothetical protein